MKNTTNKTSKQLPTIANTAKLANLAKTAKNSSISNISKTAKISKIACGILGGYVFAGSLLLAHEVFDPKAQKNHLVIQMEILDNKGNKNAGEIVAIKTAYGVAFFPNLKGLKSGIHGFHIHENPSCGSNEKGLGMLAGGHYDPKKTNKHSFAWDDKGHKGDLPALYVDKDGSATNPVLAPKIKNLNEIKNRSLMIHLGGDNHSDHPAPLGGGGARMACGVIK